MIILFCIYSNAVSGWLTSFCWTMLNIWSLYFQVLIIEFSWLNSLLLVVCLLLGSKKCVLSSLESALSDGLTAFVSLGAAWRTGFKWKPKPTCFWRSLSVSCQIPEGAMLPSLPLALSWAALPPVGRSIRWINLPSNFVCLLQHKIWWCLLLLFLSPSIFTAYVAHCQPPLTISPLCKCQPPPPAFFYASCLGFYLKYSLDHFLFDNISFISSLSLSPPPLASFMWSSVPSLPAATLCGSSCLIWLCQVHKGWRVKCQEC